MSASSSGDRTKKPNFINEKELFSQGYRLIAGLDEVGRGALAGPVVAAAVILPQELKPAHLKEVRDSKELKSGQREKLFDIIYQVAVAIGIGIVSSQRIDEVNIYNATGIAMREAIGKLSCSPEYLLVDGRAMPRMTIKQKAIIKGDKISLSIACASIIAKVTRDRIMVEMDGTYPEYGFASHKGYGTSEHLKCLQKKGPSSIHRYTFGPVRDLSKLI